MTRDLPPLARTATLSPASPVVTPAPPLDTARFSSLLSFSPFVPGTRRSLFPSPSLTVGRWFLFLRVLIRVGGRSPPPHSLSAGSLPLPSMLRRYFGSRFLRSRGPSRSDVPRRVTPKTGPSSRARADEPPLMTAPNARLSASRRDNRRTTQLLSSKPHASRYSARETNEGARARVRTATISGAREIAKQRFPRQRKATEEGL